jgi:hypothetical protein
MASLSANPGINDALVALAPQAREDVMAFARNLHERNLSTKSKAEFDLAELLKSMNVAQTDSVRKSVIGILKRSRSRTYLNSMSLLGLIQLMDLSQKSIFEAQIERIVLEKRAAKPTPKPTLDEILAMLTVNQRGAVLSYANGLIATGRLNVSAEILWIVKTLSTSQVQDVLQRTKQLVAKRKLQGLAEKPTIADILVLLSPSQRQLVLGFARDHWTCNVVAHSNKRLKIDNPNSDGRNSPRWMTVQGGLSRK